MLVQNMMMIMSSIFVAQVSIDAVLLIMNWCVLQYLQKGSTV